MASEAVTAAVNTPAAKLCARSLIGFAAVFLFVAPFTSSVAVRNIALGIAFLAALALISLERPVLPAPPRGLVVSIGAWAGLCVLSLIWSIDPRYSAHELKSEVFLPIAVITVFFVGAERAAVKIWSATLLAGVIVLASLALGEVWLTGGWEPLRWHGGLGAYSTWLVMTFPLVLILALPPPALLIDPGRPRWPLFALLVALVVGSAYLTLNRIIWPSLALTLCVFCALSLLTLRVNVSDRRRLLAVATLILVTLVAVFMLVVSHKAHKYFPNSPSVEEALGHDARLKLWNYAFGRVAEAPILGHGFGRGILRNDFHSVLTDVLLWHGHNIALNAVLQMGILGLLALGAVFVSFIARYLAYLFSPAVTLNIVGVVGLSFLAGFVCKNLTDDFFVRHTGLLFWAFNAMLVGYGERLMRERPASAR